ncbi:MAG: LAGLIDADG family homing endonuclease, partial [Candidatus Nanoarchaeia archaeon]
MSKVVVLKTRPETVLQDYKRLMNLANYKKVLPKNKHLILKLNLSWSLYYPACSTEPWQLEGVIKTLREDGYKEVYPVENRTVVTDVWKGARGNKWLPILQKYGMKYYPLTQAKWVKYRPKHEMLALDEIFPEGTWIPEIFIGKNVMHLPTMKCVHPNTQILLENGELIQIKDLVNNVQNEDNTLLTNELDLVSNSKKRLYTLNKKGKITKEDAIAFWKTPVKDKLIKIETKTGRSVKVSKEHPFLTPKGWIKARDLTTKDRIAIPTKIRIKRKSQVLPTLTFSNLKGKKVPKTPKKTSKEFWRWIGYIIGEGYVYECNGSTRIEWTNKNNDIVKDYIYLTNKLFGLKVKKYEKESKFKYYIDSKNLGKFLKRLYMPIKLDAYNKRVPNLIFRCPKSEIYSFLQTYIDCDGTLGKDGLHITTASEELSNQLQNIFQNLGITSFKNET